MIATTPRRFVAGLLRGAAALGIVASAGGEARADLKLCNRMSYVVEAAIGIDDKGATATRGWFRIDPAQCRVVAQGNITVDRLLLHARALAGLWRFARGAERRRQPLRLAGRLRHRGRRATAAAGKRRHRSPK